MKTTLNKIARFSKCPRFYRFMEEIIEPPKDKQLAISESAIKKAYNTTTETNHLVEYRRIAGWVDTEVFKNVSIENHESFTVARVVSEHILTFIQMWMQLFYLIEQTGGYTDLNLDIPVGDTKLINVTIPIILPLDPPIVTYIDNLDTTETKMYNDIKARGLALATSKALSVDNITVRHLQIKPRGGFEVHHISANKDSNNYAEAAILQLISSIDCGVNYPSVTEQCLGCAFRRRCKL